MDSEYTAEYKQFVDNLLDMIDEMKESGDYHNDTLDEIIWRIS